MLASSKGKTRARPSRPGRLTRLLTRLGVSAELLPGGFGVSLTGRASRGDPTAETLTVRDCRRILQYDPAEIRLSVSGMTLVVTGADLRFASFVGGTVTIVGTIKGVYWP